MKKRRIYLLLIIILLTIEFIIIYFGNVRNEQSKIQAKKSQTTGQIIGNEIENMDIVTNDVENNNEELDIDETIAELQENDDNVIISEEITNDYNIEDENIIEEQEEIVEINTFSSSYNEDAFIEGHLKEYPAFGERYGTLFIDKIGVNAPIIFGANTETILNGVGHDSGSYFPGESGSIIMCEHNYLNHFNRLRRIRKW